MRAMTDETKKASRHTTGPASSAHIAGGHYRERSQARWPPRSQLQTYVPLRYAATAMSSSHVDGTGAPVARSTSVL